MKTIKYKLSLAATLLFSGLFIIIGYVSGPVGVAVAQTPCYTYQPSTASTVSVNLVTSMGVTQTITIPNQNPPSILQSMDFHAANNLCAISGYNYTYTLNDYFVTSGGLIPFHGTPFEIQPVNYDPTADYSIPGPFTYDYYSGLSDIGLVSDLSLTEINNEDAIINTIDSTHQFTMKSSTSLGSVTMSAPATNCVHFSGNGPIPIVFMRGRSLNYTVSDFVSYANNIINGENSGGNGLKTIDPFKSYFSQFSFYLDLKDYDDTSFPTYDSGSNNNGPSFIMFGNKYSTSFDNSLKSSSSCFGLSGSGGQYIFGFNLNNIYSAWSREIGRGSVYLSVDTIGLSSGNTALTILHELGHSFASLYDEYTVSESPSLFFWGWNTNHRNCSSIPSRDFRSSIDNKLYGAVSSDGTTGFSGCDYLKSHFLGASYFRPSKDSIMKDDKIYRWFNVISCGYIISAIKGESVDKTHAQTHWSECMNLQTVQDGIPPVTAPPTVGSIIPVMGAVAPNTFQASGSGFDTTGNVIILTPVSPTSIAPASVLEANSTSAFDAFWKFLENLIPKAHGQTTGSGFYQIDGVSSNGSSLIFSVPTTTPDGTYKVSVSGLNSPLTNTPYTITVSGNGAGDPSTAVDGTGTGIGTGTVTPPTTTPTTPPGGATAITCPSGYTLSSTTCTPPTPTPGATTIPATLKYSCPTGYTLTSNTSCYRAPSGSVATIAATASYSCPSGYSLQSGNSCYKAAYTTAVAAHTVAATATYSCPGGGSSSYGYYFNGWSWQTGNYCHGNTVGYAATYGAATDYSCPAGAGNPIFTTSYVCNVPASSVNTPSSTVAGTVSYSCPSGYTLSGTTCNVTTPASTITPTTTYSCPTGYTRSGMTCNIRTSTPVTTTPVTPTPVTTVPTTSTTPTSLRASTQTRGQVNLSWSNSSIPNIQNIEIERAPGSTGTTFTNIATVGSTATSYKDTGLAPSQIYQYRIRMALSGNTYGRYSSIVRATTQSKPTTPRLTASAMSSTAIKLIWIDYDTGIASYNLFSTSSNQTTLLMSTTSRTYTVTGLNPITRHCYVVQAVVNPMNLSAMSTTVCATTRALTVTTPTVYTTPTTPTTPTTSVTIPATVTYTCLTGYTLNATTHMCKRYTVFGSSSVSPTTRYSCPSGYTLNSVNRTCVKN